MIDPRIPKSDQFQTSSVQPHQEYDIKQYEEVTWLSQIRYDYTANSYYVIYKFLFNKVGRMYFLSLGVKGLMKYVTFLRRDGDNELSTRRVFRQGTFTRS